MRLVVIENTEIEKEVVLGKLSVWLLIIFASLRNILFIVIVYALGDRLPFMP